MNPVLTAPRTSRKRFSLVLVLLAVLFAAAAAQPQQQQGYCINSLAGLMECLGFMNGAGAASAACCKAYEAAFDADPFCLCYVADGTLSRATGIDVDVGRALQIPVSCGQVAPPIEICTMQGLVLPPFAPEGLPAVAAAAAAPESPAPATQPGGPVPSSSTFTTPPPPPPTSAADPSVSASLIFLIVALVVAMA